MRLLDANNVPVQSNVQTEDIAFGIGDPAVVIDILRSRLYQHPIRTLVQEYICNARDANIEADNKTPIDVGVPSLTDLKFTVRDYGPGLSPERVKTVFVLYGASTKRSSDKQIGGFGIGAKSGWSYSDSFMVTSWHEGRKRDYIAHLGSGNEGTLSLIADVESNDPSGVRVEVPVKPNDVREFTHAIARATFLWSDEVKYSRPVPLPKRTAKSASLSIYTVDFSSPLDSGFYISVCGVPYFVSSTFTLSDGHEVKLPSQHLFVVTGDLQKLKVAANREVFSNLPYAMDRIQKAINSRREDVRSKLTCEPAQFLPTVRKISKTGLCFLYKSIRVLDGCALITEWDDSYIRMALTDGVTQVLPIKHVKTNEDLDTHSYIRINLDSKVQNSYFKLEQHALVIGQRRNYWCEIDAGDRKSLNRIVRLAGGYAASGHGKVLLGAVIKFDSHEILKESFDIVEERLEKHRKTIAAITAYLGNVAPISTFDLSAFKRKAEREAFVHKVFRISCVGHYGCGYGRGSSTALDTVLKDCKEKGYTLVYCTEEDLEYPSRTGYWSEIIEHFQLSYKIRLVLAKRTQALLEKMTATGEVIKFPEFIKRVQTDKKFSEIRDWVYVKENRNRFDTLFNYRTKLGGLDPVFNKIFALKKHRGDRDERLSYKESLLGIPKKEFELPYLGVIQERYPMLLYVSSATPHEMIEDYVKVQQQRLGVVNESSSVQHSP